MILCCINQYAFVELQNYKLFCNGITFGTSRFLTSVNVPATLIQVSWWFFNVRKVFYYVRSYSYFGITNTGLEHT